MKLFDHTVRAGASSALILLSACGADKIVDSGSTFAKFRLLHATQSLGPVDVQVGSAIAAQGVTYGNASAIALVPSGAQHIVVRSGGQLLGQFDATLSIAHINTVVVAAGTPQLSTTVVPDTGQVATNRANLRMVNVVGPSTAFPTDLAVLVKAPNANPDSVLRFGLDATVASYGTLMYFDAGHFDFKFVADGVSSPANPVLTQVAFDVAAGEKKAVVLERDANGVYKATVVVEQ